MLKRSGIDIKLNENNFTQKTMSFIIHNKLN